MFEHSTDIIRLLNTLPSIRDTMINACALNSDGKDMLLAPFNNPSLTYWTYHTSLVSKNEWKQKGGFHGHTARVNALAFSVDGKNILSGSSDMTLRLWDKGNGNCIRVFGGHTHYVTACAFVDANYIISASFDKTVKLWDRRDGTCSRTFSEHKSAVLACIYFFTTSPHGAIEEFILSASSDNTLILWDINGNSRRTFNGHTSAVRACAISPDKKSILSASHDKTLKLWNLQGQCLQTFVGHIDYVVTCAFSPDGKWIISSSYDKTTKLWNLKGDCVQTLGKSDYNVIACAFNATQESIFSILSSGEVTLWDAKKSKTQSEKIAPRPTTPPPVFSIPADESYTCSISLPELWEHFSPLYPTNAMGTTIAVRHALEQRADVERTKQLAQESIRLTAVKRSLSTALSSSGSEQDLAYIQLYEKLQLCYYQMKRKLNAWFIACLSLYNYGRAGEPILETGRTLEHINVLGTVIPLPDAPYIHQLVQLFARSASHEEASAAYDRSAIDVKAYLVNVEKIVSNVTLLTVQNYHNEILSLTNEGAIMLGEWCIKPIILFLRDINFSSKSNSHPILIESMCAAIQNANKQRRSVSDFIDALLAQDVELPLQMGGMCSAKKLLTPDVQMDMMSPPQTLARPTIDSRLTGSPGSAAMQTTPTPKRKHLDRDGL